MITNIHNITFNYFISNILNIDPNRKITYWLGKWLIYVLAWLFRLSPYVFKGLKFKLYDSFFPNLKHNGNIL